MAKKTARDDYNLATDALHDIDALLRLLGNLSDGAAKLLLEQLEEIHASVQVGGFEFDLKDDTHTLADLDVLDGVRLYLHTLFNLEYRDTDDAIAEAIRDRKREAFMAEVCETEKRLSDTQRQALLTGRIYLEKTRARMHELGLIASSKMQPLERPSYWTFSATKLGAEVTRAVRARARLSEVRHG